MGLCVYQINTVNYKCSNYRNPKFERTLAWNDPNIRIKWPNKNLYYQKKIEMAYL